ncbi:hypothetical protein JCM8547_003943 [Rhodosporidiobolus lusitaniae]
MAATAGAHPFSAAAGARPWSPPDFSKEARRPRASLTSPSALFPIAFPPDEEKGRSFRSTSQSGGGLFSGTGVGGGGAGVIQQAAGEGGGLLEPAFGDDDAFLESWSAAGGAQGQAAAEEEEDEAVDELAEEVARPSWLVEMPSPRPSPQPRVDWVKVLDDAVTKADGRVDLGGRGLVEVPSSIGDLSALVSLHPRTASSNRTFARTQTTPASPNGGSPFSSRTFGRTASGPFSLGAAASRSSVPLHITLSDNELTPSSLSNALWTLNNTVSLSLRKNQLDHLPESVGRLENLEELSVGGNSLQYLPAEVLLLTNLQKLHLFPNPFLPTPSSADSPAVASADVPPSPSPLPPRRKRLLGPLTTHFTVPSLRETCIRLLLSPLSPTTPARAIEIYDREAAFKALPNEALQAPFVSILRLSHSSSNALSSSTSSCHSPFTRARQASSSSALNPSSSAPPTQPFDPLSSVCCSPAHPDEERVFYAPAVERIEWVSMRRLTPAAGQGGGGGKGGRGKTSTQRNVPVRWRGCGAGCLDWLEEDEEEEDEKEV